MEAQPTPCDDLESLRAKCAEILVRLDQVARTRGVSGNQWFVLRALHKYGPHTNLQLAARLCINPGAMTRLVDALEHRRFVTRVRGQASRRTVTVSVTPLGREVVSTLETRVSACGRSCIQLLVVSST